MERQGDYKEAVKFSKMACDTMLPRSQMFGPVIGQREMDTAAKLVNANDLKQAASLYRKAYSLNAEAWSNAF